MQTLYWCKAHPISEMAKNEAQTSWMVSDKKDMAYSEVHTVVSLEML